MITTEIKSAFRFFTALLLTTVCGLGLLGLVIFDNADITELFK